MLAFVGTSISHIDKTQINQLEAQTTDLQQLLVASFDNSLRNKDEVSIRSLATRLIDLKTISRLLILNKNGEIITQHDYPNSQGSEHVISAIKDIDWYQPIQSLDISLPVNSNGEFIGSIQYGIDISPKVRSRADGVRSLLLISVICLMIGILFWVSISRQLTSRLRKLETASHQILHSHYDIELEFSSSDELGSVARAFNRMASTVRERITALETAERDKVIPPYSTAVKSRG